MKPIIPFLVSLWPALALAQNYPSPTFNAATANSFAVPATVAVPASSTVGILTIGALSTALPGPLATFAATLNNAVSVYVQNKSTGALASTNVVLFNSSASNAMVYGINSTGTTGSGALNVPSASYVLAYGGPLVLATGNAQSISLVANGAATDALTVTSDNIARVPLASAGTSTSQIASTAFVATSYAPLASPALTGTPTAPTASVGTSTTQVASTAFVASSYAPLAIPALTGSPTAPTASVGTSTTQVATTAFVIANAPLVIKGQVFTSSGTFTIPATVTALKVTAIGGGGGSGGGNNTSATAGGGGGGTVIVYLSGLTPGNTINVTVGGSGSAGGVSSNGGTGGSSSISSGTQTITTATANGGAGSQANGGSDFGGGGGNASGGTLNIGGGAGAPGNGVGGTGGATTLGGAALAGANGNSIGGGAGGNTTSTGGGNAGAAGAVVFEW